MSSVQINPISMPATNGNNKPPEIAPPSFNKDKGPNILLLFIAGVVLIIYYLFFSSLAATPSAYAPSSPAGYYDPFSPMPHTAMGPPGTSFNIIEILLWVVFISLLLINGMSYIFDIDVIASIKDIFSPRPTLEVKLKEVPTVTAPPPAIDEVFHVSNNKYGYQDAKAICDAYGARLANYKDMDAAFDKGADWCSYGWSEGQMALFPTQQEHWDKLQSIEGHKNDCGRPGINGGYIANPNVRFGVNCYGKKPSITATQSKLMSQTALYPKSKSEIEFDAKVNYWKDKLTQLSIAPFNHNNWSVV